MHLPAGHPRRGSDRRGHGDPERSLCWVEAENRKHSIRAILAYLCPKTKEDADAADAAEARMNAVLGKIGK